MKTTRQRRAAGRGTHVKLSVTVPADLAQLAEERVAAGAAPSVSAVVSAALERDLAPDTADELDRLVQGWIDRGEINITDEHRAWAKRVLDL